jgi:hypothetical protein
MTASGPILWYMRMMGFKGWTSLWNVCYYYPGWEHHEWLIRHEETHLAQMRRDGKIVYMARYLWQWLIRRDHRKTDYEIEARANEWPAKQGQ